MAIAKVIEMKQARTMKAVRILRSIKIVYKENVMVGWKTSDSSILSERIITEPTV